MNGNPSIKIEAWARKAQAGLSKIQRLKNLSNAAKPTQVAGSCQKTGGGL